MTVRARNLTVWRSALVAALLTGPASAAEWRAEIVTTQARTVAVETSGGQTRVAVGARWFSASMAGGVLRLLPAAAPSAPEAPQGALPDARVASGKGLVARAWFAGPTRRYRHGVLGDAIEAESLVIVLRDGSQATLRLGAEAVFEDIEPRIAVIGGAERILAVKSYLDSGAALAVIDPATAMIVAETPPIGRPNAWLNPAGIADFDGDGATDIALVRQPHVLGRLELWSWRNGALHKTAELQDMSNHVIGSRVLGMSATADFDGDGHPDLALPSLDRKTLRLVAFAPKSREIARISLPARSTTNLAVMDDAGRPALLAGLDSGALVLVRRID